MLNKRALSCLDVRMKVWFVTASHKSPDISTIAVGGAFGTGDPGFEDELGVPCPSVFEGRGFSFGAQSLH